MPVKNRHLFGWFKHPTHIGWHIYLPLLWHGKSVLFHGEIPHFGVKWNPWLFGRLNPKCLLLKTTLDTSFSCLNPNFIQFLHQTISNLHVGLLQLPIFPWFSHIFATSMLHSIRPLNSPCPDARPVVAPWTARCPCERPPNTTMRGLGHSGVPWSDGFWSSMGAWQMTNMAMLPRFLHDFIRCVGWFEWRMELGFQWSVEWKYMGNIMTM